MKVVFRGLLFVIQMILKYDNKLLLILFLNSFISLLSMAVPTLMPKLIIDGVVNSEPFHRICVYIFLFAISSILFYSLTYFMKSSIYMCSSTVRFKIILESGLSFINLPFFYTESLEIVSLSDRSEQATANNSSGFEGVLHRLASFGGTFLIVLLFSFLLIRLSFLLFLLLSLTLVLLYCFETRVAICEQKVLSSLVDTNHKWGYLVKIIEDILYYKDIIVYNMKDSILNKLESLFNVKIDSFKNIHRQKRFNNIISSSLLVIQELIIYIIISNMFFSYNMSLGTFYVYLSVTHLFCDTFLQLIRDVAYLHKECSLVLDLKQFLDIKLDQRSYEKGECKVPNIIKYENVSFKYPNQSNNALNNISIDIYKCEKIAIIGLNGAGKTTFVNLLTKLYNPSSGKIYFDEINLNNISSSDLYDLCTVIPQKSNLFAFSLAENVSFCSLDETDLQRVSDCLDKVGLSYLEKRTSKGLFQDMTKLFSPEGLELSGGELQKLALARALYRDTPIFILDEPTSAYDALSEEQLYNNFHELTKNKTVIYISHHMSTTRFCDKILYFSQGNLVEYGSHNELIKLNGEYSKMFKNQALWYKKGEFVL